MSASPTQSTTPTIAPSRAFLNAIFARIAESDDAFFSDPDGNPVKYDPTRPDLFTRALTTGGRVAFARHIDYLPQSERDWEHDNVRPTVVMSDGETVERYWAFATPQSPDAVWSLANQIHFDFNEPVRMPGGRWRLLHADESACFTLSEVERAAGFFGDTAGSDKDDAGGDNQSLATVLARFGIDPALADDGFRAAHPFSVAIRLAMAGFRVMPTRRGVKKMPLIKRWPERASASPAQLAIWQSQFGQNYSILTGRENGVIVLDIDGEKGRVDLAKLEAELGPLPVTWRCESGRVGGGFHLWFSPPPGDDDLRNQQPIPGHKIDIRGHHGHIVVSGSLHHSGNRYAWAPGCSPDEIELAECPEAWWDWLPKKESATAPRARSTSSTRRGPPRERVHDPTSLKIGDGEGYGGFQNPIFSNAKRYFRKAGPDAPADIIMDMLRKIIEAAPKDPGRDVSRYLDGPDLERQVERARDYVKQIEDSKE